MAAKVNILAIDTSSKACSVALLTSGSVISSHQIAPMQQGRLLLPAIHDLLEQANLAIKDLGAIAYGHGPGSFTGLRLSAAVVQALSYTSACPVYSISSMAILSQTAFGLNGLEQQFVALDARMQQLYLSVYRLNDAGIMVLQGVEKAHHLEAIDASSLIIDDHQPFCAIGQAWGEYRDVISPVLTSQAAMTDLDILPSAVAAIDIAKYMIAQGDPGISSFDVVPKYLS